MKEEKICTFTQNGKRLQLLKVIKEPPLNLYDPWNDKQIIKYQVRLNRKLIDTDWDEFKMRKLFAMMAQNIVLQLKIF